MELTCNTFLIVVHIQHARGFAFFKMRNQLLKQGLLSDGVFITTFRGAGDSLQLFLT